MALEENVRTLAGVPAFVHLEADALRLIAFAADTRILRSGDVLFEREEIADCGYVVLSGSLSLRERDDGPAIAVPAPALVGEAALLTETRRPATATARENTVVLRITRALYHRVVSEHPESAMRLREAALGRLLDLKAELAQFRLSLLD